MTTRTKNPVPRRETRSSGNELARLRAEVARLRARVRALEAERLRAPEAAVLPALPAANADGNLPPEETLDILVARQIIRRRRSAGWSQAELAAQAGVRQETVSRLESGKHTPNGATVDKLDRALRAAGV